MKKRSLLIFLLISAAVIGLSLGKIKSNLTPDNEISIARKMLSNAELNKSSKYARADYTKAAQYYDSAMIEWRQENQKLILLRDYKRTTVLAKESTKYSKMAIEKAKQNLAKAETQLINRINTLEQQIKYFEKTLGNFPVNETHQGEINKCKLQYTEGVLAYKNKNYAVCKSKLDSVENIINTVFVLYEEKLKTYLNNFSLWKNMEEQTINDSKKHKSLAIIVDKLARECTLYKNGKVIQKHSVELGVNWIGDKNEQGDKSTPEGFYKIIDKKSNGQSQFYKALLLDYPNIEDKKRFVENINNGTIKPNASIGNLIEIHGDGGKGVDWTNGCIALTNNDMDELFKVCPIGAKVTIVGSTKSFNELFFDLK